MNGLLSKGPQKTSGNRKGRGVVNWSNLPTDWYKNLPPWGREGSGGGPGGGVKT
jgi:hypothetical protein